MQNEQRCYKVRKEGQGDVVYLMNNGWSKYQEASCVYRSHADALDAAMRARREVGEKVYIYRYL